jgi:hypothetical protein
LEENMNYIAGVQTLSGTGLQQYSGAPFPIVGLRLTYGSAYGGDTGVTGMCVGVTDGASQTSKSEYNDGTNRRRWDADKLAYHMTRSGGVYTPLVDAEFVSFDNLGGGVYGFTLNQTVANTNYPAMIEVFG